jgi:hypothetical protein
MSKTTTTTGTRTLSQVCHFLQQETPNPAVVSGVVVTPKDNVCEKQRFQGRSNATKFSCKPKACCKNVA